MSEAAKVEEADKAAVAKQGTFGTRHIQICLMFLGMSIAYGQRVSMSVAVVAMKSSSAENKDVQTFDWDESIKSLILSSFFWGYILTQIPAGYVANIWSSQRLLSIGIFICGLLNLVVPFGAVQGGWIMVCIFRLGMGLCQGCLLPCVQTLLSKWAPPSERARLGTFAYAGAQFGTVITMPISGWLASSAGGWPNIFYTFGVFSIIWSTAFYMWGSDSPSTHPSIKEVEKEYIESSLGQKIYSEKNSDNIKNSKIPWKQIFTSMPMWALIIAHCGQNWGYWMLLTEIPSYLNGVLKLNIGTNGSLSALPYLVMWILSFPLSFLADYALRRGVSRAVTRKVCNSIAHWGPAIALIILALVPVQNLVLPITLLTIAVGLNAGSLCGFQINHIDLSPQYAGTMMSITNCISNIVSLVAPLICGAIVVDTANVFQWQIIFYISALIYFLGNLIFIICGRAEIQWWNDPQHEKFHKLQVVDLPGIS